MRLALTDVGELKLEPGGAAAGSGVHAFLLADSYGLPVSCWVWVSYSKLQAVTAPPAFGSIVALRVPPVAVGPETGESVISGRGGAGEKISTFPDRGT